MTGLLDTQGRAIDYLRLSVTDLCNCRCTYCLPGCGVAKRAHADVCSLEELAAIAAACARLGVRKVRLTGGEPLVRRGVVGLVRMLASTPGIREVDMTTNATLLAPVATDLRAAGLSRVNVSLDSVDAATYAAITRGGRLADALAGLDAALAAGFDRVKVNCVVVGGVNDAGLADVASLARDRDIDVRFIELMPIGECADWPRERFVTADAALADVLAGAEPLGTRGVAELWRPSLWRGRVGLIRPMSHRFCGACDRVRVTADGRMKPCLHSADEVDLRGLSGRALERAIVEAVRLKPAHHDMYEGDDGPGRASGSVRGMNRIGG